MQVVVLTPSLSAGLTLGLVSEVANLFGYSNHHVWKIVMKLILFLFLDPLLKGTYYAHF